MLRDLSHPIRDGMTVYPGDPSVAVRPALSLETDGVEVARIDMGSHTGTHVDAPAHTVAGGRTMASVSLDELVGEAVVLRVPGASPGSAYGLEELTLDGGAVPDELPRIVIIDTGWAQWFGSERALRHPFMSAAAAKELWARGMRVLAVDTLSPDETGGSAFPVHDVVLGGDGLIVENVCGLEGLPGRVEVGFFPLRLEGDGAPVRGVAFL
ncbi:cyclase family protein [Microbacterium sp.]|uniref:cyclase family protein n=1 Tax=Microbacterium sp. TaxID=51671 RepID=UPI002D764CB8|nr:cyclase family protein [Microbacterium sp.]HET6301213.1 cyclase family protein [Microbacterium sp.]